MNKIYYYFLVIITFMLIITSCTTSEIDVNETDNDEKITEDVISDKNQNLFKQETLLYEEKNEDIVIEGIPRDKNEQYKFFLDELLRVTNNCKSCSVKTIIKDNNTDDILWLFNPEKRKYTFLWFYPNGDFFIGSNYNGVGYEVGKYEEIDTETIKLYGFTENFKNYIGIDNSLTEIKLTRKHNKKHFYYEELLYIEDTDDYFGNISTYTGDEGEFDLNGNKVTKFFGDFVTNDNVKFRTGPYTNSSTLPVPYNLYGTKDFFLKGTKIYVMARTTKTYKIDEYNNYWYYIFYLSEEYQARGWVYGEFIEPYKQEMDNYYNEIFLEEAEKVFGD